MRGFGIKTASFSQELDAAEDERAGAVGPRARERETDAPVGRRLDIRCGS